MATRHAEAPRRRRPAPMGRMLAAHGCAGAG